MSDKNAIVAIYNSYQNAANAIRELQEAGFDMQRLSVVGKDRNVEKHLVGYYLVPGIGPILVAGPLATYIANRAATGAAVEGPSVIGFGLHSIGIPKASILEYEAALKAEKFLVIAQGTRDELLEARQILAATEPVIVGEQATDTPKKKTRMAGRGTP
jgi:hypothetical protein